MGGDIESPEPLTRFWVRVGEDGHSAIPQFRPEDGSEIMWGNCDSGLTRLLFVPFTEEFAAMCQKQGTLAIPLPLPTINIPLSVKDHIRVRRRNYSTTGSCYKCTHCGNLFDWFSVPPDPVCPKCGEHNFWFCPDHGKIDQPVFVEREVRCPLCDYPRGLQRSQDLVIVERPFDHRVVYEVEVNGKPKVRFDENIIDIF